MTKAQKFLRHSLGPRRLAIMGLSFALGGLLVHVLRPRRPWTSEVGVIVGVTLAVVGIVVEIAVRSWLRLSVGRAISKR
jgi:hypothetical protein